MPEFTPSVAEAVVPSGVIAMWHGTIANIPSGWVVCDGNNSTPNLLAKFVEGIATAATNPGATGGGSGKTTAGHQHDGPISFNAAGNDLCVASGSPFGTGAAITTNKIFDATNVGHTDAAHKVKSNTDSITDIRPSYYDVAFIMKT